MRFCLFLAEEGLLTDRQALVTLSTVVRETPPLGRLALRERWMTVSQLRRLLSRQAEDHRPFGTLAVSEGFLTPEQLDELLRMQIAETPRTIDVVERLGFVDGDLLHVAYHKFHGREPL